ncbi:MAG: SpoVA/SpoVAEb family sporulation membrane protein [Bacilli bacterium]|nr:SpoVA/SpoVAEb family sporulation membrane protein [Bacilli bacterium]
MIFIYSFLCCGMLCLIAQILLDNTKLTPGHITSIYTVIGAFLAYINVYDLLIKYCGAGATSVITNFGASLYKGSYLGIQKHGILGLFMGMFSKSSAIITSTIIFGLLIGLILKPRD